MYSFSILVNTENPLNPHYIPSDLMEPDIPFYAPGNDPRRLLQREAAIAAEELFKRAQKEEIHLWGISGYRSYKRQEELFSSANGRSGVAPPGCSEHQTGLALDISCPDENYELEESFAKTKEGCWLARHCALFGFILRYPKNKEEITGFPFEPWHIRYTGIGLASSLTLTGMTLEEYYERGLHLPPK